MAFPTRFNPEDLESVAERLLTGGAKDVAVTLQACANSWREDQGHLHTAQTDNTHLQRRITDIGRLASPSP
jgi:hypothetical protein